MKVSKWGNSLAIRLPAEVIERLGLKEGDELVEPQGFAEEKQQLLVRRKRTEAELLAVLAEIRKNSPIPADYKFKRSDAYDDEN